MSEYQLTSSDTVLRTKDGACIPNDPANRDRAEYSAWLKAGGVPDPYVPPAPPQITSVTPRQARLVLYIYGLLDQVEVAVNAAGGTTKITWDYATVITRDDPLISQLAQVLKLSDAQIDEMFTLASTL